MKRLSLFVILVAALGAGCDMLGLGGDTEGTEALYYVSIRGGASEVAIAYDEDGQTRRDTLQGDLWSHQLEDPSGTLHLRVENLVRATPDSLIGRVKSFILVDDEVVAVDSTSADSARATVQYEL